jgi:Uma2 family endonuclease
MTPINIEDVIKIPGWITDLESFRRWAHSEEFPDRGMFAYFSGDLWVETSMETVIHNKAKGKVCSVLEALVSEQQSGHLFVDRMRLTHPEAGLSTESDGLFASNETLQRQRLQVYLGPLASELIGSPDMVLEVVSTSSVQKDTVVLFDLYWKAGVTEYWLIDPRGKSLRFDIYKHGDKGFVAVKPRNGWLKSSVLGKSFRLSMSVNGNDLPIFTLDVR